MSDRRSLRVGTAEVDITPPVGTALAGSLQPRESLGIDDPLYAKAIVLESGGCTIAYVILDLVALMRQEGDEAVRLASARTGIPEAHIVWSASHTHSGPYTRALLAPGLEVVDSGWLAAVPGRIAEAVAQAHAARRPARMSRVRGFHVGLAHNRRLAFKDGRHVNTWLLGQADDVQCVGSAGAVDPEVGVLAFDDERGQPMAVMFQYTLHANTHFGRRFSGDYPAVVAARLRERFGPQVCTLYVPGACADVNRPTGLTFRQIGDALADVIIGKLEPREPRTGEVAVGATKRDVVVPYRDFMQDQEERIRRSGWPEASLDVFRREVEVMRQEGVTESTSVVQAWRIGEVAFASLPGELFLDWGLKIKRESPFPWTYPVELGGDYLGYLITPEADTGGGYEPLIAHSSMPTADAVGTMVDQALEMLGELHGRGAGG